MAAGPVHNGHFIPIPPRAAAMAGNPKPRDLGLVCYKKDAAGEGELQRDDAVTWNSDEALGDVFILCTGIGVRTSRTA